MKKSKLYGPILIIALLILSSCSTTKLFEASKTGNISLTDKILSKNVNLNKQNKLGETPLIIASKNGKLEIVEKLVVKGADINIKDKWGNTALMHALLQNYTLVADYLLNNHAMLSLNNDNVSPLNVAADIGSFEISKRLIEAGADVNHRTSTGETPIFNALFSTFTTNE